MTQHTFKDLFPDRSPEELEKAEENLRRYLRVVAKIFECIHSDPERHSELKALTEKIRELRMEAERSNFKTYDHILEA